MLQLRSQLRFKPRRHHLAATATLLLAGAAIAAGVAPPAQSDAAGVNRDPVQLQPFRDESGAFTTFSTAGRVDLTSPFFKPLGSNGRTCQTCHQPAVGWTITPASVRDVFEATGGRDPLFRTNDGTDSPEADVSTVRARRRASSMLLSKGLIRIGLPMPGKAEFRLEDVDDPYAHASAADLSLFRRPLPTANLPFLSTVMWDGRENQAGLPGQPARSIHDDLVSQATDAINGHAQRALGVPLTPATLQSIVAFESGLFMAQTYDDGAGRLDLYGGRGGPLALSRQGFFLGINDPLGGNPTGAPFNPSAFTLYSTWADTGRDDDHDRDDARAAVARGEALFNTKSIPITGVAGLNDVLHSPLIQGTCTTCHDTPNAGNHSVPLPLNIGLADASRRTPDLPLYTLVNTTTGEEVQTTDPGRALITGKWVDIGKFKGATLRGLATRAPYFHNGSAARLEDVVTFYDTRFTIGLTRREKRDLAAFLRTL